MKIKTIVFDLDDTLLDTSRLLLPIAGTPEFFATIQQPLPLMEGAEQVLRDLAPRYFLILLTQGDRLTQQQKINSLGISSFFQKISIVDNGSQLTKKSSFKAFLQDYSLKADELLSIGNRRSTDIRPAKSLGAKACLFLYGEHMHEDPQVPEDVPDYEVTNHWELISRCKL